MLLCLAYTARGEEIEKDTAKIRNVELNEVIVQSFKQQRDLRLEPHLPVFPVWQMRHVS